MQVWDFGDSLDGRTDTRAVSEPASPTSSRISRRRLLTRTGLLVGGAASFAGGVFAEPSLATESATARTARPVGPGRFTAPVIFRTAPSSKLVALTIDDGPTSQWTPVLLNILQKRDIRATFFRIGQHAAALPDLVRRTADEGHEQGNHTWAHDDLTQHDEVFDQQSVERTHDLLTRLLPAPPTLLRPPYGRIDSVGLAVCARLHYSVVLWSAHVTGNNAANDVNATLWQSSPGTIVLAHDGGSEPNQTLYQQLDRMIGTMTDDGYRFVTMTNLLAAI